jgi:class 3 adenylate cyclase/tetratricopeptide (TPR) repeat protein
VTSGHARDLGRPYAPRIALRWLATEPGRRHRLVDGSLLYADISGFTRLSERLATRGRAGAEEVVALVGRVMTALVGELEAWGGDVCVFAGDALIVLFEGAGSASRAARAAAEVRAWIAANGLVPTSVGRVTLRVSIGVATGPIDLVLAGGPDDRALFLVGATTTSVVRMEREAAAGEVMVDQATVAGLAAGEYREGRGGGCLLRPRSMPRAAQVSLEPAPDGVDAMPLVTRPLRPFLAAGAEAVESEHRQGTIAFVLAGGIDDRLRAGPGGVSAVADDLDAWFGAACVAGARHGVTVLDTDVTADGAVLFLAAGAPVATGDEEERMLRALRDILAIPEAARLRLRAGTNRGPVFAGDLGTPGRRTYTAMGDTTNLAARIAYRAAPGELLATADVLARSATEFASESLPPFAAKGKREPVVPYRVGEPSRATVRHGTRLPLTGRDAELEVLRGALRRAGRGEGGLVDVTGEAGAGKSRLIAELLADHGVAGAVIARCSTSDAGTPYGALRAPLRELAGIAPEAGPAEARARLDRWVTDVCPAAAPWLPLLGIPLGIAVPDTPEVAELADAFRRTRLHAELARVLQSVLPVRSVLLVEDVHWADEATLALLEALAGSSFAAERLIVVARRPGPLPQGWAPIARVDLEPLVPDAVARLALLAADRPISDADLAGIVARAAGNPLFARELTTVAVTTGSVERLPERLESLLASRIDRLPPRGRRLLRRAAVMGKEVDLDLLAEAMEGDPDARDLARWNELREFVAWQGPSRLRFRHDLVRDAAYEGLAHARRAALHRDVARAMERRAGDDTDAVAAQLATHFAEGGLTGPAFRYARRAGDLARAQYANADAASLYARALASVAHGRDQSTSAVAAVAEALGDVSELAGRYAEASAAYDRARSLLRRSAQGPDDPAVVLALARLARKRGIVCERTGRYVAAIRWYQRGRRLLDRTRDAGRAGDAGRADGPASALAARLAVDVGGIRMRQGRYAACVAEVLPVLEPAEQAGHRDVLANAHYLLHAAYGDLGSPEVARHRDRALPIYEALGDLVGQGNVLNNLGIEAYFEGRWDDALDLYRRSREAKQRAGDIANAATQSNNEAEILSDQGRLEEAVERFRDALRVWSAAGYQLGAALATSNLGRAEARAGRHAPGLARLEEAAAAFGRIGADGYVAETHARMAECLALAGHGEEAAELARSTLDRVRRESRQSVLAAQLERTLAWSALLAGDPEAAATHVSGSLREARALNAAYEVAVTLDTAARLPRRSSAEAARDRDEAAAIFAALGVVSVPMPPTVARASRA